MKKIIILSIVWCICALTLGLLYYSEKPKQKNKVEITTPIKEKTPEKIIKSSVSIAKEIVTKQIAEANVFYSEKYNIPLYIIYALEETESDFKENADSKSGPSNGRGIVQVSDIARKEYNNWHKEKYSANDMYNIEKNLEVGLWYFDRVRTHYLDNSYNFTDVYLAYNVGPSYFKEHKEELYNGIYKGCKYNALDRWAKYLTKYYLYFKF